ncbi:MAG: putative Fe-S cluster assembly protein SufT [Pseudomonadales bacterium]|nr:putative Fe-S cluster assembly protein SufT [Pseudomonadales bacterium]
MERRVIPVTRTIEARLVPIGTPLTVPEGAFVTLTQALGGACTIVYNGNMARVEPEDVDALGLEREVLDLPPPTDGAVSSDQVWQALRTVHDPEIPVNIVDLGLIYDCTVDDNVVGIDMTLTAPGCGMGPVLVADVERRVGNVPFVQTVNVNLVFDPPWGREMMSDEAQLELGLF